MHWLREGESGSFSQLRVAAASGWERFEYEVGGRGRTVSFKWRAGGRAVRRWTLRSRWITWSRSDYHRRPRRQLRQPQVLQCSHSSRLEQPHAGAAPDSDPESV